MCADFGRAVPPLSIPGCCRRCQRAASSQADEILHCESFRTRPRTPIRAGRAKANRAMSALGGKRTFTVLTGPTLLAHRISQPIPAPPLEPPPKRRHFRRGTGSRPTLRWASTKRRCRKRDLQKSPQRLATVCHRLRQACPHCARDKRLRPWPILAARFNVRNGPKANFARGRHGLTAGRRPAA